MTASFTRILSLIFWGWILSFTVSGQTRGLIFEPSTGTKSNGTTLVLDPDGNGYVDQASDGIGFTSAVYGTDESNPGNDVPEFEIPMLPFPTIGGGEALRDIRSGPDEGFTDFSINNNGTASYYYLDDEDNFIFRFRLADFRPNAKGYTVLIDTDQKFGEGDDPDYNSTNPGFEIAIMLRSKHEVSIIDIDGETDCGTIVKTYSLTTNHQKSISGIGPEADGTLDYFYDFYVPFADITSHFTTHNDVGGPVTTATKLRMTATTNTSNTCAFEGSLSDVGGVDDSQYAGCIECLWEELIEGEVPTDPSGNGGFPPVRTDCPTIDGSYSPGTINVYGNAEPGATVQFYVNGTEYAPSATVTADAITGEYVSGDIIASLDDEINVTATLAGYSESKLGCNSSTVTNAPECVGTSFPATVYTPNNSGQSDVTIPVAQMTLADASSAVLKFYSNGEDITSQGSFGTPTSDGTTVTWVFDMTGNAKIPCGTVFVTIEDIANNLCPTISNTACNEAGGCSAASASAPTITTDPITTNLTSISGTSANGAGLEIIIYADGVNIGSGTTQSDGSWTVSGLDLSTHNCKTITASAGAVNECVTESTNSFGITEISTAPTITDPGFCGSSSYVYGTAFESDGTTPNVGATVFIYLNGSGTPEAQTSTVNASGDWTVNGLTLLEGNTITATVIDNDNCQSESTVSNSITIGTQSSNASPELTITTTDIVPSTTSLSGTCSGSATNVNVYIDNVLLGAATSVSGTTWTLNPVPDTDDNYLYEGGKIQVTQSVGGNCESELSDDYEIVYCESAPETPSITYSQSCTDISYTSITDFSISNITEVNVMYRLVDKNGDDLGYSFMSTSDDVTNNTRDFTTIASKMVNLTDEPPKAFTVEASYFNPVADCSVSTTENFYLNSQGEIAIASTTDPSSCELSDGKILISGLGNNIEYSFTYKKNGTTVSGAPFTVTSSGTGTYEMSGLSYGEYSDIKYTYNGCTTTSPESQTLSSGGSTSTSFPVVANPASVETGNASSIEIGNADNVTNISNSTYTYSLYKSDGTFVGSMAGDDVGGISISTGNLTGETTFYVVVSEGATCTRLATEPTVSISSCTNPTIALASMSHPTTCSGSDGEIVINGLDANTTYEVSYTKDLSGVGPISLASDVDGNLEISNLTSGEYSNISVTIGSCTSNILAGPYTLTDPTIPAKPSISAGSATTFCDGGSVTLTSTTDASYSYQWYKGSVAISGATGSTYSATTSGDYSVIVSANGCVSPESDATTVTVNAIPAKPSISAGSATTFCDGGSVTLTSTTDASYSYQWYKGSVAISGATGSTYSATTSGDYS
ncbi:hypothetical protein, partial [Plebeiibacterium marinum]